MPARPRSCASCSTAISHVCPTSSPTSRRAWSTSEFDRLGFLWAGGAERGQPHYYRIQGERVFIEYDNSQRGANHVHTVWRDLANDFGGDALARHYAQSRH